MRDDPARAPARPSRGWRAGGLAALAGMLLVAGCSTQGTSGGGWIDRTLYGTAQGPPQAAYAGADRVKVHSDPDPSAPVEGVLALHEQVARYQRQGAFVYVEAEGNLSGWVRASELAASRPAAHKPEQVAPAAPSDGAPTPDGEPPEPEPSVFDPY